jgi:hypothetical protein
MEYLGRPCPYCGIAMSDFNGPNDWRPKPRHLAEFSPGAENAAPCRIRNGVTLLRLAHYADRWRHCRRGCHRRHARRATEMNHQISFNLKVENRKTTVYNPRLAKPALENIELFRRSKYSDFTFPSRVSEQSIPGIGEFSGCVSSAGSTEALKSCRFLIARHACRAFCG